MLVDVRQRRQAPGAMPARETYRNSLLAGPFKAEAHCSRKPGSSEPGSRVGFVRLCPGVKRPCEWVASRLAESEAPRSEGAGRSSLKGCRIAVGKSRRKPGRRTLARGARHRRRNGHRRVPRSSAAPPCILDSHREEGRVRWAPPTRGAGDTCSSPDSRPTMPGEPESSG